jgi:hypothetical protein
MVNALALVDLVLLTIGWTDPSFKHHVHVVQCHQRVQSMVVRRREILGLVEAKLREVVQAAEEEEVEEEEEEEEVVDKSSLYYHHFFFPLTDRAICDLLTTYLCTVLGFSL